ncbi:MAG: transcription antitermination factor NusB [Planctomycetota bacterium]
MSRTEPSSADSRQLALRALRKIESGQVDYASQRDATRGLDGRDRGLFLELVNGVCRWRATLDRILNAYVGAGIANTPDDSRRVLELALYQLLFLDRIPTHAVVDCAVSSLRSKKARGFVNAVLRTLTRELGVRESKDGDHPDRAHFSPPGRSWKFARPVFPDPQRQSLVYRAFQMGFEPEALILLEAQLGSERAGALVEAAQARPLISLRPRAGGGGGEALLGELSAAGHSARQVADHPAEIVLCESWGDPLSFAGLREGRCSVQGSFAARVAELVDPQAGETVADLCGAPGGKAAQMAEKLSPTGGRVIAWSMDELGLKRIRQNAKRLDLNNLEAQLHQGGVGALKDLEFGALLLDVPCSNSGVLDRRPLARHRLNPASLANLRRLQSTLLDSAMDQLAAAGKPARIIYSTCSVLLPENEGLIASCLETRSEWRLVSEIRGFPDGEGQDGGYAARLELQN